MVILDRCASGISISLKIGSSFPGSPREGLCWAQGGKDSKWERFDPWRWDQKCLSSAKDKYIAWHILSEIETYLMPGCGISYHLVQLRTFPSTWLQVLSVLLRTLTFIIWCWHVALSLSLSWIRTGHGWVKILDWNIMHGGHVWVKRFVCTQLQIDIILWLWWKLSDESGGWVV